MNKYNICLAVEAEIPDIINIIKERCKWFKENNINQ